MQPIIFSCSPRSLLGAKRVAGILIACFLLSATAVAQDFYLLKFKLVDRNGLSVTYTSLLTLQPDGNAVSRTVYYDSSLNAQRRITQNFLDSAGPANSEVHKQYLVPTGEPDSQDDDVTGFVPHRIVFEKKSDSGGKFYSPVSIDYLDRKQQWQTAETDSLVLLTFTDLMGVVLTFYNNTDPFYQHLLTDGDRDIKPTSNVKLYLIAVSNTLDSTVGPLATKDSQSVVQTFRDMAKAAKIPPPSIITVSASNFNKKAVDAAINKVRPGKNDILVFYYSGHGFRFEKDTVPFARMSLRTNKKKQPLELNNLSLDDVYKRLLSKGARFTLVLGDCCNTLVPTPSGLGNDLLRPRKDGGRAGLQLNPDVFKTLFLSPQRRSILVSSAEAGQKSWGNEDIGSYYTFCFMGQLKKWLYGAALNPTWPLLLKDTKNEAALKAKGVECEPNVRCKQYAVAKQVPNN